MPTRALIATCKQAMYFLNKSARAVVDASLSPLYQLLTHTRPSSHTMSTEADFLRAYLSQPSSDAHASVDLATSSSPGSSTKPADKAPVAKAPKKATTAELKHWLYAPQVYPLLTP